MRVFQFISAYLPYIKHLETRFPEKLRAGFRQQLQFYLNDRYYACHWLGPVLSGDPESGCTIANDDRMQQQWAREKGLKYNTKFDILRAQIEEHRAEVLYSLDPITFDSRFIKSLPSCVKKTIAWNAAPKGNADLSAYNLVVSNFPHIQQFWKAQGMRIAHFFPGHDPLMDGFTASCNRPVDICFAGQYSSWWEARGSFLSEIAKLSSDYLISFRLLAPQWKTLGKKGPLARIKLPFRYLPPELRDISHEPVYGLDLYRLFSSSKIVFNAGIDAKPIGAQGNFKGNMRCFEALGCGACMVSDAGNYSDGFLENTHFVSYESAGEISRKLKSLLSDPSRLTRISTSGNQFVREKFSKANQWSTFQGLVDLIS